MGTNGYETRTTLLLEAKEMLYQNWHGEREMEMRSAQAGNREPRHIAPPDIKDILALAEKMNEFVSRKQ